MGALRKKSVAVLFVVTLYLLGQKFVMAAEFVPAGGYVYFGSTSLCALVLINGQSQFSCDGTGRYDMNVPLNSNGKLTVQVFAAGFEPLREEVTPQQVLEHQVDMIRVDQGRPFQVDSYSIPSAESGWFRISGKIEAGEEPICSLVLANGQKMFSCGDDLGKFDLDVPPDEDENITLQVFAAGFEPYRKTVEADPDTDKDGIKDRLDDDDDNDGIFDVDDVCPIDSNPDCGIAILPSLKLYVKRYGGSGGSLIDDLLQPIGSITDGFGDISSIGSGSFEEVSFPYASSGTVSANITGTPTPTKTSLGTFKLLAEGGKFTIINLSATDSTNRVAPFFTGISNNLTLVDGSENTFDLVSPLTRGLTVNLNYRFEIRETGDTFSVSYSFRSN